MLTVQGVCRRNCTDIPRLYFRTLILLAMTLFFIQLAQPVFNSGDAQATVYWTNSSGTADGFSWANGGSDKGLFGDPTLVGGNTLVFSPSNFRAESSDGDSAFLSDRLEIELIAHSGYYFQSITVLENGDYEILGTGSVDVLGSLSVENLYTSSVLNNSLQVTPLMPVIGEEDYIYDIWSASTQVGTNSTDWTYLKIVLQNDFITITCPDGSIAWIQKKDVGNTISIQMIPEPATNRIVGFRFVSFHRKEKITKL